MPCYVGTCSRLPPSSLVTFWNPLVTRCFESLPAVAVDEPPWEEQHPHPNPPPLVGLGGAPASRWLASPLPLLAEAKPRPAGCSGAAEVTALMVRHVPGLLRCHAALSAWPGGAAGLRSRPECGEAVPSASIAAITSRLTVGASWLSPTHI